MSDRLVLKEYPIALWIFGGGFLIAGVWALIQIESWVAGLFMLGFGLLFGVLLPAINTVTVDPPRGSLTIQNQWLYRRKVQEYALREIASIDIERSFSSSSSGGRRRSNPTYRIVLVMESGEKVPLQGYYSSGYKSKEKKARQLSEAIGVPGPMGMVQKVSQAIRPTFQKQQEGEASGVSYRIETAQSGAMPVTRWVSTDFTWPGGFLLLAQKPSGSPSFLGGGGMVGAISQLVYRQIIGLYGFQADEMPGLESAQALDLPDPTLQANFSSLTSDVSYAQQLLTPWVVIPLTQWVERHPLSTVQVAHQGQFGQLLALYAPGGLYLVSLGAATPQLVDELTRLGVDLARALPR